MAEPSLTRTEVQAIVREFLEENPEAIIDSLGRYEMKQRLKLVSDSLRPHTPTLGPENAPITIIEFSEFQCPFCLKAQKTLAELRRRYKGRVRFAFKHVPLDFHPQAEPAALAAQAAHLQGKFWDYSAKLWEGQAFLGEKLLVKAAEEVGLDMEKFNKDRQSEKVKAMVEQDLADAKNANVRGTPHFLVNGVTLSGAQPLETFVELIEGALAQAGTSR
jgi:protein-disulfide isomerase